MFSLLITYIPDGVNIEHVQWTLNMYTSVHIHTQTSATSSTHIKSVDFEPSTTYSDSGLVAGVNHANWVSDVNPEFEEQQSKFQIGFGLYFW